MDSQAFITGLESLVATLKAAQSQSETSDPASDTKSQSEPEKSLDEQSPIEKSIAELRAMIDNLVAGKSDNNSVTTESKSNPTPPTTNNQPTTRSEAFTPKEAADFLASFSKKG